MVLYVQQMQGVTSSPHMLLNIVAKFLSHDLLISGPASLSALEESLDLPEVVYLPHLGHLVLVDFLDLSLKAHK